MGNNEYAPLRKPVMGTLCLRCGRLLIFAAERENMLCGYCMADITEPHPNIELGED